ncbi:MAG: ComEC/Rec2 family competence protein [Chloroflexi bacterium]|nr:ComEC/Rec2 family competence protein [Chloroflexota bacterium]
MLLIYLALAFVVGITLSSLIALPALIWAWWLFFPLGLLLIWRRDPCLTRAHLCLLLFLLGALRLALARPTFDENALVAWNDKGARAMIGDVIDPPEIRDYSTQVRIAITRVRIGNDWCAVNGLALVNAPRESDVRYGDRIQIYGEPTTPPEFEDWSYKEYLARQGIHSLVRIYSGVKTLERDQGNPFFAALYAVRDRAHDTILAIFPEPSASLLAGILLGVESGIPRELNNAFSATNTAHIIAISGFNIAIIAGILTQLAGRVTKRGATFIVIAGLVAYTLFVGASASVVRAAVMGSLSVLARALHRPNDALNALAASAIAMTAWDPFTLYDMGFQLSFLATLGLILYVTPLTRAFENMFTRFTSSARAKQIVGALSDSLIVTLAAQITTTPLIVFAFHRFSPVGLLANFLVLWVQPAVMLLGGTATLVALIVQPVGQVLAWLALPFLEWTIRVVQTIAALPVPAMEIGRLDVLALFLCYAIIFGATLVDWRALRERIGLQPAIALSAMLVLGIWVWNLAVTAPDGKTHVVFLDGGGAATFIRTPSGAKILIDGGESPSATVAALGSRLPFWDRTLDLVVLTNADDAHLAGLVTTLERYDAPRVVQVDLPAKPNDAQKKWNDLLAQKRVAILSARDGVQIALDREVTLEVAGLANNIASARLRAGGSTFLIADNATTNDQATFVREMTDASTVLVAPKKIAPEFFGAVNPQFALVFAGRTARDKPSPDLLATLAPATILRTDERGAIEFIVDAQSLAVKTAR